ncbi:MAG: hypothetical protein HOL08_07945 [Opitutae bacterium]|jgi:hypothetical protein|nr:hypothetical protein [Opitutae bacterium]
MSERYENEIGLRFLNNDAGEQEGLGDAGIETFRDSPYASSARECGQNSRDAGVGHPISLSFDLLETDVVDIPAHEEYLTAVKICLEQANKKNDEKEFDFFFQAKATLEADRIKILRISDENTTGLVGPSVEGTPFHSLLKGTGVSTEKADTSGGSFGIGKNAVYAISDFQTVFYSTVYTEKETGKKKFLAQGKTKLVSHIDKDGAPRRATGYWGDADGFNPVSDKNTVPDWLKRDTVGTSVFSLGFNELSNWQYRMASSLIQNFFCAIYRGEMVFSVNDGEIEIDQASLAMLFNEDKILQAAADSSQKESLSFSQDLHECLTSPETNEIISNIDGFGKVSIRVLIREGLTKRVCIVRNGMVITDSLENFGDKFSHFPMYQDFIALVEPMEDKGSALIKKLENPRHDGLSAQRISNQQKKDAANTAMKELAVLIRETIKEQTILQHGDEVSIDEMSEFFTDDDSSERQPDEGGDEDPGTFVYEPRKKKKKPQAAPLAGKGKKGGAGVGGGKEGGGGSGSGPGTGAGKGGDGKLEVSHIIELGGIRNTMSSDGNPRKRIVYLTPQEGCEALITVWASGINSSEELQIVKATGADVSSGKMLTKFQENDRIAIEVEFSEPYSGPIELSAVSENNIVEGGDIENK